MGVVLDIIELLIGFYVIPGVIVLLWLFILGYLGISNFYLVLLMPIILLIIITIFMLRVRRMIAYGLILSITIKGIENFSSFLLPGIPS